jgi:hypothetical protein
MLAGRDYVDLWRSYWEIMLTFGAVTGRLLVFGAITATLFWSSAQLL